MDLSTYWNVLLEEHRFPCLLADLDSEEVLFANPELEKLLDKKWDIIGEKFYDLIRNDDTILARDITLDWSKTEVIEQKIFDKTLNNGFVVSYMKVEFETKQYLFAKYESIDYKENFITGFEETMSKCINVLQEENVEKIPTLLKILGEYYEADKTYLYQVDHQTGKIPCSYYWRRHESVTIEQELSGKFDTAKLLNWFKSRNEVGVIEASMDHASFSQHSNQGQVLSALGLENIVISVIEDPHQEPLAIIAVSNRKKTAADFRLLQAVSRFMEKDISTNEMTLALQQMNDIDILTGFHNRITYSLKVDLFNYNPPFSLGVLFININGLKKINSEYGLAKGDGYIKQVADILKNHYKTDFYRISGDEFVAFFSKISQEDFDMINTALRDKMEQEDKHYFSMGDAWKEGLVDVEELIREADTKMYINKQDYYHSANRRFTEISDSTLSDLLTYLDEHEFLVYLQPQVELENGRLHGAEALIRRFDRENQKMVFPDQFISLYERKSVVRHIDIFVIEEVCKLLSNWQHQGNVVPISVNLSRVTLQEYGIVETIANICDKYGIDRQYLVIEVTERVGLVENNVASSIIVDFKERGFKISLDDFGSAYSNIVTLAQIEVDEVKLDKSLVDFLTVNEKNFVLVKNVLSMCNELKDTITLAEGIESQAQAELLQSLGCKLGQGYYYSRPIPVDEFCEKYMK